MQKHVGALLTLLLFSCDDGASSPADGSVAADEGGSPGAKESAKSAAGAAGGKALDDSKAPQGGAFTDRIFDKEIRKQACELLTPEMVAAVAGVEADALERLIKNPCIYEWKGSRPGRASLGHIRTHKTVEAARTFFENANRDMSGEEVAAGAKLVAERAEKDEPNRGKQAGTLAKGLAGGVLAEGFKYEPVEGIGDRAMWNGTRREIDLMGKTTVDYDSQMSVLVGNMAFTVAFEYDKEEPKAYKEETTKLSKMVVENLPAG